MPQIGEIKIGREIGYSHNCNYIWHACVDCGKERWVRLENNKPRSLKCKSCAEKGKHWKKGKVTKSGSGYVLIWLQPDNFFHSMATKHGYVLEHRLVVAKALGRCLHRWEIVHHKGAKYPKGSKEDKADNRYPENLQLVTDDRHKQISILENRIQYLEKRITLLEAENVALKKGKEWVSS